MHEARRGARVHTKWVRPLTAVVLGITVALAGALVSPAAATESAGVKYKYRTYSSLDIADMPAEYAAGVQWGVTCSGKVRILRVALRYGNFRPGNATVAFLTAAEVFAGLKFSAPTQPDVKTSGAAMRVRGKTLASFNVVELLLAVLPVGKIATKVAKKLTGKNMVKLAGNAQTTFKLSLRGFLQHRLGMSKKEARWIAGEFVAKTLGSKNKLAKKFRSAVKSGTTTAAKIEAVERLLSSRFVNVTFPWFSFDQTLKLKTNGKTALTKTPRGAPGKRKDVRYEFTCPKKKPKKPKKPASPVAPGFTPGETRLAG